MKLPVPSRFYVLSLCIITTLLCLAGTMVRELFWVPAAVFGALSAVGIVDIVQTRHAIRRNYPILAHLRFFFEYIRPEIRQYFLESDTEATPFSRAQRSIVYQRAKVQLDKRPFGTLANVYEPGFEWLNHSVRPIHIADP